MILLLDTPVWIWSLLEPARLPPRIRRVLTHPGMELRLSPVSAWEALVLAERGRLRIRDDPRAWIEAAWKAGPWREVPLAYRVAAESRRLRMGSDDSADRFLAATALVYGFQFLTADRKLRSIPGVKTITF